MKQNQADRVFLSLSICGFLLVSVSFLLMPVEQFGFFAGGLFWIGLLLGALMQVVLEMRRRNFFAKYRVPMRKMQRPRNGLLTFGANRPAKIADCVLGISAAFLTLSIVLTRGTSFLCYILIGSTIFSFSMHCVLNGRIYFHAKNQLKVRQVLEQKKAKSIDKGEGENE